MPTLLDANSVTVTLPASLAFVRVFGSRRGRLSITAVTAAGVNVIVGMRDGGASGPGWTRLGAPEVYANYGTYGPLLEQEVWIRLGSGGPTSYTFTEIYIVGER